eukprot:3450014-Prymnesium_polylepis.1
MKEWGKSEAGIVNNGSGFGLGELLCHGGGVWICHLTRSCATVDLGTVAKYGSYRQFGHVAA